MYRTLKLVAFSTLVLTAFLLPSEAEARRGIAIINYGDTVKTIGPVAEPGQLPPEASGAQVGYVHNRFGLFWLDVWTWDGRYCLFQNDSYWEIEPEQAAAALGVSVDQLTKPMLYRVPPGLVAVLVLVVVGIGYNAMGSSKNKQVAQLFEDARYRRALELIEQRTKQAPEDSQPEPGGSTPFALGFEDGVKYLEGEGINRSEAEANLGVMVNTIVASQQEAASQG